MVRLFTFALTMCALAIAGKISESTRDRDRALLRLDPSCDLGSCYPPLGDLLIGREASLFASSTCGSHQSERYCDISDLRKNSCFWCESNTKTIGNSHLNHGIQNVIYKYSGLRSNSWWQSENGKENTSIRLDLEGKFHLQQIIIKFKTLRPKAMLVERSADFGKTWRVDRYFAYNCTEAFPEAPEKTQSFITEVVCESQYSGVVPLTGGQVNFRLLPLGVSPYFLEAQNFLRTTNLRINFTKFHVLAYDDLLDSSTVPRKKYYYAIEKMSVLGSCSCNGHAARCIPMTDVVDRKDSMVHGRCKCSHNTHGLNCEICNESYHHVPWQPAVGNKTNAC